MAKIIIFVIFVVSNGVLAQLVERLNGIQKVSGSIPLCSTKWLKLALKDIRSTL